MRIRGAKTELEEAGESTEGMVESTATLREEIKALSGVDIMASATEFKSTYQILDELSEKWEDLSDIAQATIIEKMAGKHQGNVFSSLMENFDTARAALETSLNSSGSAMQEHEKWQKSLEAQILSLKASWQGLSQAFLSSDFLSGAIKGLTGLIDIITKLVDTLGTIPALFTMFIGGKSIGKLVKNIFSLGGAVTSFADAVDILKVSFPTLSNVISTFIKTLIGGKGLGAALTAAVSTLNPVVLGIMAAVAAIGTAAYVWDKNTESAKELSERIDDVTTKYKEQHNELSKLKGDYDTTNEDSMISKYGELSKGVNELGENISLTADEYAEYRNIISEIANTNPDLVTGYNSQGDAILKCAGDVNALAESYKELIKAENEEVTSVGADVLKDFKNDLKDTSAYYETQKKKDNGGMAAGKVGHFDTKHLDKLEELMNLSGEQLDSAIDNLTITEIDRLSKLLEEQGIERNKFGSGDAGWENKREHVIRALNKDKAEIKAVLDGATADLNAYSEKMGTVAEAYLSTAFLGGDDAQDIGNYAHFSERMQNVIGQAMSGLGTDFYSQFTDENKTDAENYAALTREYNKILSAFNSMSNAEDAQFEAAFDLKTKFNGGEISYGEYVSSLQEAGKLVDDLGLNDEIESQIKLSLGLNEDGFVDQYQTLLNRLKQTNEAEIATGNIIGLNDDEAKKLLNSLSAQELSVLTKIIPEIDANATREQIEAAIDREMVLSGLIFDLNLEVEAAGIESLNTALSESVTASGLSSESISALKSRYAELESQGWDLSSMFEETSHGIHVNRNELSKFENELSKQKLSEVTTDLDRMKKEYDKLGEAIKNASGSEKASLFDKRQSLAQKISEAATLAAQYEGLTSAYNQWLAAEEAGNERDMYENVLSGFETVKDELSRGWADDSTIAFLEMLTGRTDLAGKSGKELKEVYDGLGKTIENTKYSVKDFFTKDKDGNSTSKGVYNFLDAIGQLEEEKFGYKDVVKRDGKGNVIGFDFELAGGDEAIAEALGVSEELVQIMVRAADDAGFVVSMDGTYKQLADLQNEAKAAADYLKEIGKTDFEFDFNTSNVENLNTQLEKAKEIWKSKEFWNEDGTFNFDADGAEQSMQIVSTLQAKIDDLTQKQYGIGLTVEDEQFEEPLEKLQSYGDKIGLLNQLELNPKVHAEEIDKLNSELDDIAEYFANLDKDTKVEVGFEADDNVDEVKKKIESGEVKIPTTLDIQTNIDKNISDLKDLMLLNWLPEDSEEAKAIKIRLGIEVEPEVKNPEAVGEEIKNEVETNTQPSLPTPTIETPVEIKPTSHVQADKFLEENGIVPSGQLEGRFGIVLKPEVTNPEAVEDEINEVTGGKNGTATEPVTVAQPVELDLSVKEYQDVLQDLKDADKDITIDVTTNGLDDVIKLEESVGNINDNINLSADIEGNVDNLIKFADGAKTLGEIDSNIAVYVTADIEGNVLETVEEKIDNLKIFAEGAKEIQGVESSYITIDANVNGNIFESTEDKLDNLKVFAEGAQELDDAKSAYINIDANVSGNVIDTADEKIKNVKSFAEAAKELQNTKDAKVAVVAEVSGSALDSTEDKLKNLKTFAEGAKELQDIKNVNSSVKVNLEGNLNDDKTLENLAQFAEGAKALQGIDNSEVTITVSLNGNFLEETKDKIDNLVAFAEGAKEIQGVKGTDVSVVANLDGSFLESTEEKLDNLKIFAEGAKELQDIGNKEVSIIANAGGSALSEDDDNLNRIKEFAEGAQELQGVESSEVSVTANIKGNVHTWSGSFNDLRQFAAVAKELQGTKSSNVKVTANIEGSINESNVSLLENFASVVKSLPTGASTISVKANVDTASISSAIGLLEGVANSGLFKDYEANVKVTFNKVSDAVDSYNPLDLDRKVTYHLNAGEVYAFNPPNLHRYVYYHVVYLGGGAAEGGGKLDTVGRPSRDFHTPFGPQVMADGTAHANGTVQSGRAFDRGDWRTKDSGIALMGELGPELIIRDGKFFTVGNEGAGFYPYKRGDIIFNHKICGIV